jgi:glycosyltransferase involved in cell wall biosynthesis
MKVVRVIARLNVGGPSRHVVLLDQGLGARGHDTLLVHGSVAADEASLEAVASASGIRVLKIAELGPRISPVSDLRAFVQLVRALFRESPDVVHTHTAKAGTLGRLAALVFNVTRRRRRRALVVHTFHGHVLTGYFSPPVNVLVRCTERTLASITDCIVTISPAQREDIVSRFRVAPAARTSIIPLGLDLRALLDAAPGASLRGALGLSDRALVIGYIGRFVPIKDLGTLVRAFALVAREIPDATLVLAGDGSTRGALEELVTALGLGDRVRLVGWTTTLVPFYGTMDICALSSLNEGTPVAVIEAMAAAKAVVATRVGGVGDVVEDGRTGVLVPPADPEAFARALVSLARDPERRREMGTAARAAVASRFSHERLVADVERLYVEALRQKRGLTPAAGEGEARRGLANSD